MNIIEMLDITIRFKDELQQKITICSIGVQHQKDDIRESEHRLKNEIKIDEGQILKETDFKSMNITNKEGRESYVLEQQQEWTHERQEKINEDKMVLRLSEERLTELKDEYKYYTDRRDFLLKIFEIEGNIELEDYICEEREKIKEDEEDDEKEPTSD